MGRRRLQLRDWIFGSEPRRRLLEVLLASEEGDDWRQIDLARAVDLFEKGSVDVYLDRLVDLDLLVRERGRYRLNRDSSLVKPLQELLEALPESGLAKVPPSSDE